MRNATSVIPIERIQRRIFVIRGQKVMLDEDLAEFYQVTTYNLNKAVARNIERFPVDFLFRLTAAEFKELNKQLGTAVRRGGRRTPPFAFSEQGVAMLSAILKSKRAILVSVQIMRSFVKLRELLLCNETFARRLKALESKTSEHAKVIVQIINELQKPPEPKKKK